VDDWKVRLCTVRRVRYDLLRRPCQEHRDVARRFIKQGYAAFAGDFLSRHGGAKKVNPKAKG